MEISIDEAGSFSVNNAKKNSWCVVAAYATPETEKRKYIQALGNLKKREGKPVTEEIKLHQIKEDNYFQFLKELGQLKGILFCTATDSNLNLESLVKSHQKNQVDSMMKEIDKMLYEGGKEAIRYLSSQMQGLPAQLYIQLACQIQLMLSFIYRGISYFVQRNPNTLSSFRWRIDQKEPNGKTNFEDAFEKFSPALLQTFSLSEPTPALKWCNYRPMKEYIGTVPDYLVNEFPHLKDESAFDLQKIIRKDIKFIDSKSSNGVQIADLLVSGVRRSLKMGFKNNNVAAHLLGSLMVQEAKNQSPIKLITFGDEASLDDGASKIINIMIRSCRPLLKKANKRL